MPITYKKTIQYAQSFVQYERTYQAQDLVHDLWLSLNKRRIDLFQQSKRFVYVALWNFNRSRVVNSMQYRHKVYFDPVEGLELNHTASPLEILISKEIYATFPFEMRLAAEGYEQQEIAAVLGKTPRCIGYRLKKQKQLIYDTNFHN